jgi:hypothetical protein
MVLNDLNAKIPGGAPDVGEKFYKVCCSSRPV